MKLELSDLEPASVSVSSVIANGHVIASQGAGLLAKLPHCSLGDICEVQRTDAPALLAEVVAFKDNIVQLAPYDDTTGIKPRAIVQNRHTSSPIYLPVEPRGKIIDPFGAQIGKTPCGSCDQEQYVKIPMHAPPPDPLSRQPIETQLVTGVPIIDTLCPLGVGQRVALIAEPGAGKSTLLGTIARNANVDVTVIALVGERGREVGEFVGDCLNNDGMKRSIVVVATSNEAPARRRCALLSATAIAELYRSQGKNVLLLVDSLTRYARAIREIALSAGELPVRHGYPASLFTQLPKVLERTGNSSRGSITAIYTLLATGSLEPDPLSDEVKSLVDGHLLLSPSLADRGLRPSIDPIRSISRLARRIQTEETLARSEKVKSILSRLYRDRDMILLGGTPDPELNVYLKYEEKLNAILYQTSINSHPPEKTNRQLATLLQDIEHEVLTSSTSANHVIDERIE